MQSKSLRQDCFPSNLQKQERGKLEPNRFVQAKLINATQRKRRKATALFKERGWKVFKFQRETWKAYASGESGLVLRAHRNGKDLCRMGPSPARMDGREQANETPKRTPGLRVLWITPLRALVEDTRISLLELCEEMDLPWTVEARTGDTSGANKTRQRKRLPSCLVTTPESLSVLLSYPDFKQSASELKAIIVDEWHELLSTKRGSKPSFAWPGFENGIREFAPGDCPPLWAIWTSPSRPFSDLLPREGSSTVASKKVSNRIHHSERHGTLSRGRDTWVGSSWNKSPKG